MTRIVRPLLLAAGLVLAVPLVATAQQPSPEPQLPPMPSMEGQQGDMGKPVARAAPGAPKRAVKPAIAGKAPARNRSAGKAKAKVRKPKVGPRRGRR